MVGDLDIVVADRKMNIEFLSDHVLFRFADYSSAREIMRQPLPSLKLIGKLLQFSQIGLHAKIGNRSQIELFPKPNLLVRWLSPAVREMLDVSN